MLNSTKGIFILACLSLLAFISSPAQWVKATGVVGGKVNSLISRNAKLFAGTDAAQLTRAMQTWIEERLEEFGQV